MSKPIRQREGLTTPRIDRSLELRFIGDWGQANAHRICAWLTQEFCDRAGPRSRVGTFNLVGGGVDGPTSVFDGAADLCVATPAHLLPSALMGEGLFRGRAMPSLRALAQLSRPDRMVFAIDAKFGIRSFADLRRQRPRLRIATAPDDGGSLIGYVAARFLEAHRLDRATRDAWGVTLVEAPRPEQSLARMRDGEVDAVLQKASMTSLWREIAASRDVVFIAAEEAALSKLERQHEWPRAMLPANYYPGQTEAVPTLDFSDLVVIVRDDMPDDVAYLLTSCLIETREVLERQYRHLTLDHSPIAYPLTPALMASAALPLHRGAQRYYEDAKILPRASARVRRARGV